MRSAPGSRFTWPLLSPQACLGSDVMAKQRPTMVLVIAILNFVFGGLGILGSCVGGIVCLVMLNLPDPPPGQPNPFPNALKFLANEVPSYTAFVMAGLVVGIIMAAALVLAGIGLLRMRPWARLTCILYGFVQIL